MIRTTYLNRIMNNVDWNNQALHLEQGFGFAYTFLTKRKRVQ